MAFQQAQTRRHRTTEATVVIDHPPLNNNVDDLALVGRDDLTQEDYDDFNDESERGGGSLLSSSRSSSSDGVLVLFPRSTVDSDGSSSPRGGGGQGQMRRLNSYHDGTESTCSSGDVDGDFSLLPSHDGNGVFIRLERGERGGIESLRGGTTSNSQSSTSNSRTRRYSISSGSLFNSEDEGEGEGGGWALTEAALSSISNHHHHSTRAILVRRNNNQDDDNDDKNDEKDLNVDSDLEIGKSLTALSAGIGHHGRRRRMTASRSPSNRNNHRLPLLPVVGSSSVQRSLSPQSSSIKRRHGLLEATASATKSHNNKRTFEQIEQEEKLRAERMKLVLQERLKENEIKRAKNQLLFIGKFSLNSLSLSPHVIQSGAMGCYSR
jgi:hypothetical protein